MAQVFKINGTSLTYITRGDWEDDYDQQAHDGNTPILRWRRHTMRAPDGMTAAEFDTLYALEGQKVSITTTNYEDRNSDYKTYYGCDLERVAGRHDGPLVYDVVLDLMVRV